MQLRIEDIEAFVLTAELQSFNRAAEKLRITQSALSRRLKKLEDTLGAKLLDRTSRAVELTVMGTKFLPIATRMVHDFDKSLSGIRDIIEKRSGGVVIASNMTTANAAMPEIIRRFHNNHSDVRVRVVEDSSPYVADNITTGVAEFGVAQRASGRNELTFEPIIDDPVVLVCPPNHPLSRKKQIRWSELSSFNVIGMAATSGTHRLINGALEAIDLMPTNKLEVAHMSTLLGLVGAGLGIATIPKLGTQQRPDLNLISRPLIAPTVRRTLGILRRKGRTLSPSAAELRNITISVLNEYTDQKLAAKPKH